MATITTARKGDWMLTFTGVKFFPIDPRAMRRSERPKGGRFQEVRPRLLPKPLRKDYRDTPMTRSSRARKTLKIPEPVLTFKIWPEWDRKAALSWTVKVFKTRGQMQAYLDFSRPDRSHLVDRAFTDQIGMEVVFCLYHMTDSTVTHEAFHCTAFWVSTRRPPMEYYLLWDHPRHEDAAEVCCSFVSQIWENFTKSGFERKQCWGFRC